MQDSIRLNLMGASMRQNISGKDIVLGDTGVIIPKNAFAVSTCTTYLIILNVIFGLALMLMITM